MQYTQLQCKGKEETHSWRCFPRGVGIIGFSSPFQVLATATCWPWWTCRTVRSKQAKYISGWKDLWNFQISKFHVDQFIKWHFPHCCLPIRHILCVNNILEYIGFFSAIVWMRMYQLHTLKSQDINSWELPANAEEATTVLSLCLAYGSWQPQFYQGLSQTNKLCCAFWVTVACSQRQKIWGEERVNPKG